MSGPMSMTGDYLSWLQTLLNQVDRAMTDEGIDPDVRERVRSRVLYGTPTPDDDDRASIHPSMNIGGL